ncbi:MAG: triose-phosphate isomerase [Cyclobacteriaceae bacterium]
MRKKIVAGNWKMNTDSKSASQLAKEVASAVANSNDVDVVICPPAINLESVNAALNGSAKVKLGAQNCHTKDSGAYTGEISTAMLQSVGASHVILGHSERREYFNESNEFIKEKVDKVLADGLTPLFCCGETLAQREAGIHFDFVNSQITESLFHLSEEEFKKVVIAYEPIWAIGTGVTASSEQAQEIHAVIRKHVASKYGQSVADETSILYGGSCKPGNAQELFACADVDGGLIGGAALKADDFAAIVNAF